MLKPLNRKTAAPPAPYPVKVLQFGEGNFLRGFVDWMIELLNERTAFAGSVQVVQPLAQGLVPLLMEQDGLYHLLLKGMKDGKAVQEQTLIRCISGALNPYEGYQAYLKLGENPDLELLISNTTEAGIAFNEADKDFKSLPLSFPGKLTALLFRRFEYFGGDPAKALTFIPCELIDKNGEALRDAILAYARYWQLPKEFIRWIEEHSTFCNTLVDRIVPGYPKDDIQDIQETLGYLDKLVVMAEPFHLWVIEGPDRVKEIFPLHQAGLDVKFVQDQGPYRTRKVRILNGAHTAMVPLAYLQGLRTVREAVEDPTMGRFLQELLFQEIIPTLDLPPAELEQFAHAVLERFKNPFIRHELSSIALNSISKFKVRVLPSILEYHTRKGSLPPCLLNSWAALLLFYRGVWQGEKLPVQDAPEVLAFFEKAWQNSSPAQVVDMVLANHDFWGSDLRQIPGLSSALTQKLDELLLQESQPRNANSLRDVQNSSLSK